MNALRTIYRFWVLILFIAVIVQIGAAGYGAFNAAHDVSDTTPVSQHQWDHGFNFHDGFGYLILLVSIPLFLFAWGAKLGRKWVLLSAAVPLLVLLQIVIARVATSSAAAVGILHPINAFIILGLLGFLTHKAWRGQVAAGEPAPAVA
jgi:hypothetical protein